MNCPNCGNELNENQRFCTKCGYSLVDNSGMPWVKRYYKEVIISSLVVFFVVVCCALALNNNNISTLKGNETVAENTETEDVGVDDIEDYDPGCGDDTAEIKQPTNLPRKCIYETSDGVCFTTKVFQPEPLNYYDCTGGLTTYNKEEYPSEEYQDIGIRSCYHHYDAWAGAMKLCNDWGYKLPNEYELTSLANDIYGVMASSDLNTKSYLPDGRQLNKNIMEKLDMARNMNFAQSYWEDEEVDRNDAYARTFTSIYTDRGKNFRTWNSYMYSAMCVYNPYGEVKISQEEYERQRLQKLKEKQQKEEEKMKNEAENALF